MPRRTVKNIVKQALHQLKQEIVKHVVEIDSIIYKYR
jgi:hypothetical protein